MSQEELEKIRLAKREYYARYRKNNPEKIKKINQNYWLRKSQRKGRDEKCQREAS